MLTNANLTLADIQMQVVHLNAQLEGLVVLAYMATDTDEDLDTGRAKNCIGPMCENLAEVSQKIAEALDVYGNQAHQVSRSAAE